MLRRNFVKLFAASLLAVLGGCRPVRPGGGNAYAFRHGVASGDPLADGVILWTRISGAAEETVSVRWPSGRVDSWQDLAAERYWTLREGDSEATP